LVVATAVLIDLCDCIDSPEHAAQNLETSSNNLERWAG
jgi:hypothetical protein